MEETYDDYDDYEPTCFEKFQDKFLYCFIPTLCLMFDASFLTVGLICLVGADSDFDKCSGDRASTSVHLPDHNVQSVHVCAALPVRRQLSTRGRCRRVT